MNGPTRFMITSGGVQAPSLTVTVADLDARAVDKHTEVGGVDSEVEVMPLAVVDALGLPAVLALDEAYGMLVQAGGVTRRPPSDGWYRLIEQLTPRADGEDFQRQQRRLCVGAAAFLAAEAHYLEDHGAALADDARHRFVRHRIHGVADQARNAVDALISHVEKLDDHVTAPWPTSASASRINAESRRRSATRSWSFTAALVALAVVYGLVANSLVTRAHSGQVIVCLFIIIPVFFVFAWYLQVRHRDRVLSFLQSSWQAAGWFYDVTRQAVLLDVRADALRDLSRRIDLVASNVAAERQVCESHGLFVAASRLDSVAHQLQDASESTHHLTELLLDGGHEARRFATRCRHDPRDACSHYGLLPLVLDPKRIDTLLDNLVVLLRLTVEVAVDIPLHIDHQSRLSTVPAGKIAAETENIFREFQHTSRHLKQECHSTLRAFDALHSIVATESLRTLPLGQASRVTARVAVAASVSTRPTARRPAARTAFLREASTSTNQSWAWIGKATIAALTERQQSLTT